MNHIYQAHRLLTQSDYLVDRLEYLADLGDTHASDLISTAWHRYLRRRDRFIAAVDKHYGFDKHVRD